MTSKNHRYVKEFHDTYNCYTAKDGVVEFPSEDVRKVRFDILKEEWEEYIDAEEADDMVEVADALADMIYIAYGTALSYGIPLDEVLAEVQRSNMSKLGEDGKPIYREDGKVLKGPNFSEPDIKSILIKHGWKGSNGI